jgi:gentisate 1,2-dioxygenase
MGFGSTLDSVNGTKTYAIKTCGRRGQHRAPATERCTMREDVAGRANVADTPELEAYYNELGEQESYALWTVANAIEPWHPQPTSQPTLWSYRQMRPLVLRALDLVSPEKAGRRVIALENPGRKGTSACVGWLYSGLQVMKPGESASAHSHASSALRFIIEGSGAYTVVDGHKMDLGAGDFVITPNGTWHDHGVETDGATTIWQDGLDMLLVNQLDANFYAVHPDGVQKSNHVLNDTVQVYGGPGLLPVGGEGWSKPYSPLFKYEWGRTYETLVKVSQATDGSPCDGIMMQYVNPATGGPAMKTLGANIQLLRAGERTKAHRHTGSTVYTCAKGSGTSIIAGKRYDWSKSDIFVVPSWAWHEHANASAREDAVLFSFSDLPSMHALGLYREEVLKDNDGHQTLAH